MIFSTFETTTNAYLWITGVGMSLEKGVQLSDYTELQEEFDEKTLKETFDWVCSKNKKLTMEEPALMIVTTGFHKSVRVWIDKALLNERPEIEDAKQGFEYYSGD